jgi:serine/threonine protein kinase
VLPVLRSELVRLELLNDDGGFGTVYRTGYKLRGDSTELAYKEYKIPVPGGRRTMSGATAEKAVRFRDRLKGREDLDRYFAWPREIVMDDVTGEICGFLMPMAHRAFFWEQGPHANEPRTLEWLTTPENIWRKNQVDLSQVTETDRLFLMVQMVYAVAWLHKRGWVFGDLSFKNAAFALDPPRLMLFDCDDAADLADPGRERQPHTRFWRPPECLGSRPSEQDAVTDVYKLGLAIVRCLKPERGATTTTDAGRLAGILDGAGVDLLTRALSADRNARPSAKDLFVYLERITTPRMVPPLIKDAELLTPLVPRGSDARLRWQIENADEIEVLLGENPPQQVKRVTLADHPHGCVFPVVRSGQVTVSASNRYGTAVTGIGDVGLFEITPFSLDLDKLPRPDIPPVPGPSREPLPPLPDVPLAAPEIPPVPPFELADVLRELAPGGTIQSPAAHINTALDSSGSLIELFHAETERFIAELRRKNMENDNG